LWAILAARWVLVIPALALVVYAGQMVEQARLAPQKAPAPPDVSWELFALAALLLAVAALPVPNLLPAGPSRFWRELLGSKATANAVPQARRRVLYNHG